MGQLRDKKIIQTRTFIDPQTTPIPDFDYDFIYPNTVYEAILKNFEDDAITLDQEITGIYRMISEKQSIVSGGRVGSLMTWTGRDGEIGETSIVKDIAKDAVNRSHSAIPSERAVGQRLDSKLDIIEFEKHSRNSNIHITEEEREKWNSMATNGLLESHTRNTVVHVTQEEREKWNSKVDLSVFNTHILDVNNPHRVTAHQIGTYSRNEIDDMIRQIRDSFFNYRNIKYNDRANTAELSVYDQSNWNPNYVLSYSDNMPTVTDQTLTYFALKPATDYSTNETQVAMIYIKKPGIEWTNIGTANMAPGDLVIRYRDTTMYVWMQGRFVNLFNQDGSGLGNTGGESTLMWRPVLSSDGVLTWSRSVETLSPDPINIRGPQGKTPVKGVDYFDGANGQGVPTGGVATNILVKTSDNDYETEWKSVGDAFGEYLNQNGGIPRGIIRYEDIAGAPIIYRELGDNEDGFITQNVVTAEFNTIRALLLEKIGQSLTPHIGDYHNPHRVTPEQIGAISNDTFLTHSTNRTNPHGVTKAQVGLGNVDNTSDLDKPISNATKEELQNIRNRFNTLFDDYNTRPLVSNVSWEGQTCTLTFGFKDGTNTEIVLPINQIFKSLYFDDVNSELVLVLPGGLEHRINIKRMITHYTGANSDNIRLEIDSSGVVKATIINDSITGLQIMPNVELRESPSTTTQAVGDRSTKIATTEFTKSIVIDNLISYETDRPLSANMGRILNTKKADTEDLLRIIEEMHGVDVIDNLESTNRQAALSANMGRELNVTKAPMIHTSSSGGTYGRATVDLFGHVRMASLEPLMDGTPSVGTDDGYVARADHRHPTDVSRAPINWPDATHNQIEFTGEPKTVSPPDDSNDHRIANTEWVRRNAIGVMKGYCTTAGNIANKVVDLRSTYMNPVVFMRQIGSTVSVLFTHTDVSGGRKTPTYLNVNNSGNAKILFGGKALTNGMLAAGYEHMFVFDGTNWRLINPAPGTGLSDITLGPGNPDTTINEKLVRINVDSGYSGMTTDLNGSSNINGESLYAWITVTFAQKQNTNFRFDMTSDLSSFGIRVPDGRIINVNECTEVSRTNATLVLQFKMTNPYPTNSPCQLMFLTNKAYLRINDN